MKTFNKILSIAVAVAAFSACTHEAVFTDYAFVAFDDVTYTVNEDIDTLVIPVAPFTSSSKEFAVTFKTIDSSAVAGVNFEVVENDANVLNFAAGDTLQVIKIKITNLAGTYTGALQFDVELVSATNDVTIAGNNICTVKILDKDHPLAAFLGSWTGHVGALGNGAGYDFDFSVEAVEDDDTFTKVVVSDFDAFGKGYGMTAAAGVNIFSGIVDAGKTKITIANNSPVVPGTYFLRGYNAAAPSAATAYADITLELQTDGSLSLLNAFAFVDSDGAYEIYLGGAVFTKK